MIQGLNGTKIRASHNLRIRGKSFAEAMFLWDTPLFDVPLNTNSGEQVWLKAGHIEGKVWGVMFVYRDGKVRIVSFRRLNKREIEKYGY